MQKRYELVRNCTCDIMNSDDVVDTRTLWNTRKREGGELAKIAASKSYDDPTVLTNNEFNA